jgi:outer membrane protein
MNSSAAVLRTVIAVCFVLAGKNLSGQDLWSLERCISYAIQNNLQIKQQELAVKQAENHVLQAKLDFLPAFTASSRILGNSVKLVSQNIITGNALRFGSDAGLDASVPLLEGLSKINTFKSYRTRHLISVQDIEKLCNEISISITQAFLQVLLSIEIEACADSSYNSVKEQAGRVAKMVEAGSQAFSTLLEIEAQLANEKVQLVTARNNVKSNTLNLIQLLDLQSYENFKVEYPHMDILNYDFETEGINEIYKSSLDLPQIKSAELSLEKSRYDYRTYLGKLFPSISFSAHYGILGADRSRTLGLGITIPIFNGWKSHTSVRNARLDIQNMELELRRSHQQLFKEITQAYNNARNSYEKCMAAGVNMEAAKESFSYIVKKFDAGMLNSTDYIVAKANLFKSQSEYLQAKFQCLFNLKILDFYKGIPIKL